MRGKLSITVLTTLAASLLVAWALTSTGASADGAPPAFVQQVSAQSGGTSALKLTPTSAITSGNRLIVVVGIWNSSSATAKSVTDSAGNTYTEVLHFKGSDNTEESVWTAPITAGGQTKPAITITPTSNADVGAAASEYSGLSTATGVAAVDQISSATGTSTKAGSVSSGPTTATTGQNELAVGGYVDSGFGSALTAGSGWSQRSNVSPNGNMDVLSEDQALPSTGATPNATAGTGTKTTWLMSTVVFIGSGASSTATVPAAPTDISATGGDASATVTWTAPSNGGSAISRYTVTPYINGVAQQSSVVSGTPPATNTTVTGLTDGTAYTFTVSATNAVGIGPASAQSNSVTPTSTGGGQWSSLMTWPMVAIHSILMDNGKVLQFDGWQQPEPTEVYDPATQTFATQTAPDSIFCSGMAELPDGRILVVGGYGGLSTGQSGIVDTNVFDPTTNTWSRVADMHYARWYPDLTELGDGRYVVISGNTTDENHWADTPEVFDPGTGQWTVLSGVSTSQVHEEEYPFSYLIPNGNVFTIGPSEDESFELDVNAKTWTQVGGSSGVVNGSSVMYLPGKVLYSGGAANLNPTTPAAATTATIDLTSANPQWHQTAAMAHARIYHTLTMLADGTVLAVGGEPTAGQTGQSEVSGGVLPSEIWNPTTQTWSPAAATGTTRGYHSTALLMPDGTVLEGGSGHANPGLAAQFSSQIYSPPYLFKGARPTISSVPSSITYGTGFNVTMGDSSRVSAVNLVSLGSDTHQSDMDQHFVPLSFTQSGNTLTIQPPSGGTYAPPGHYMLFILNSNGVPAVAPIIAVTTPATAPSAPTAVSAEPLDASAGVSWTAPTIGGAPVTSYTVTPYIGSVAQAATVVSGNPAPTATTVSGLTNGATYTFTVTATNSIGTSPASAPSNSVTPTAQPAPAFVLQASAHSATTSSLAVTLPSSTVTGDRLIVQAGVWSSGSATAQGVTDSAGDTFTELTHFKAADNTEQSIWSAPVSAGSAGRLTITVTPTAKADVGVAALEYSGLSTAADATVLDQSAHAVGKTTSGAPTVASGATPATTGANELALGFYTDSGFGDSLSPAAGYTPRVNVSNVGDMEMLAEDQVVGAGATPSASVRTGASTYWLMSTLVFKNATAGQTAQISQALKAGGRSLLGTTRANPTTAVAPITAATFTSAVSTQVASPPHAAVKRRVSCGRGLGSAVSRPACASLRRAAAITKRDRHRWIYEALLQHLSTSLLCHWDTRTLRGALGLSAGWYAAQ
jgi:hypothetical protein